MNIPCSDPQPPNLGGLNTFIFDLDGTLLDTLDDLAAATNYALRTHGMPEHSRDDVRRFVGNGVRLLMERAIPDGAQNPKFEATFQTFREYYLEHSLDRTKPYDGIMETLTELHRRGCHLAVVSNKFMTATQELVHHFFPMIPVAIGENEAAGIRKKPAPDTVLEALRQLSLECRVENVEFAAAVEQGQTSRIGKAVAISQRSTLNAQLSTLNAQQNPVYVGDSDVDIETARNSGLPCISVLWGFRDRAFLEAHGGTTFISRPQELLDFYS